MSQCPSLIQFHLFIVWIPAWHFLFTIFIAYLFTITVGTAWIHPSTVSGRRSLESARWVDAMETLTVTGRRKSCDLKSEPHGGDFVSIHREQRGTGVKGHFKLPSFGLAHRVNPAALAREALHGLSLLCLSPALKIPHLPCASGFCSPAMFAVSRMFFLYVNKTSHRWSSLQCSFP